MKPITHGLSEDDRLVPDASAAEALGISLMTLWRWTQRGLLPVVQINKRNYRRLGDVKSLQHSGTVRTDEARL